MPPKSQFLLFSLISSICLAINLLVTTTSALSSDRSASAIAQSGKSDDLFARLEALVKEYYPKAKITRSDKSIHFQTKVKSEEGYYSHKLELAPMSGGIRGDVSLEPGEYTGSYKDKLACELNEGYFRLLVLAPHCQASDCHLLAILAFPADVSSEFKSDFKTIVSGFATKEVAWQIPATKANEPLSSSSPTNAIEENNKSISPTSTSIDQTNSSPTAPIATPTPIPTPITPTPPSTELAESVKPDRNTQTNPLIKNAHEVFDRFKALDLASNPRIIELYSNDAKIYMGIIGANGQVDWRTLDKETYGTFTASAYRAAAKLNAQTRYEEPKFTLDKRGGVMVSFSTRMPGSATNIQWLVRPNKAKVWQIVDERSISRAMK
ncbi:MAG: hypothetical protein C5B53_09790 [Candidatus Melainabacteria bacterium]|nr:MAG: hypothetical protein C5B53_09790 [Candidatus Melainabacteria bacterium]